MNKKLVIEKIDQAIKILNEKKIDLWLIFVRETHSLLDPSLELILGAHCTWQSAFFITNKGDKIAIVGNLDAESIKDIGAYENIIAYQKSIREDLVNTLNKLDPQKIAINYSSNDYMSDGLTHGMYLLLCEYLKQTPYINRFVSSEDIIGAVRGRKSALELQYMRQAVNKTLEIFDKVTSFLRPGLTEQQIAQFILENVKKEGLELSWDPATCPAVFSGPDTAGAHYSPTARATQRGHIMNIDFGVKYNGFCADLQRTWYFLKQDEHDAPEEVKKVFYTVRDSIQKAADAIKPGVEGWIIDKVARDYIIAQGYDEFPHGLGHQVGRAAHDGAGGLLPLWEKYGNTPHRKIEVGQIFTIEPRITCEGYGIATIEEEVVVTENGCEFISNPQQELFLV